MTDSKSIAEYKNYLKEICFNLDNSYYFLYNERHQLFYDQDFCLIHNFPLEQMIFVNTFMKLASIKLTFNCPTLWLMRYHSVLRAHLSKYKQKEINYTLEYVKNMSLFDRTCRFEIMLNRCQKSNFSVVKAKKQFELDFMIATQLMLVIFQFLTSIFGIVTSSLVIVVILHKETRKTLKEKQYTYMAINGLFNFLIFLIHAISLINECDRPFGIFCSSIREKAFVQYFKIVFVECFSSFLSLLSNFSYVAFSINRISLIGNKQSFVEFFSEMRISRYMSVSIISSGLISLVKAFRFRFNLIYLNDDFPHIFVRNNELAYSSKVIYNLIFGFDLVYDLICYIVFTFVNFVLDLVLVMKIRETLDERQQKLESMLTGECGQKILEKKQKENDEAMNKVRKMIVANTLVNFLLKSPSAIISINDIRLVAMRPRNIQGIGHFKILFNFPYSFDVICYQDENCMVLKKFFDLLYLISLSVNIFFYIQFDKKFKQAFKQIFSKA